MNSLQVNYTPNLLVCKYNVSPDCFMISDKTNFTGHCCSKCLKAKQLQFYKENRADLIEKSKQTRLKKKLSIRSSDVANASPARS